MLRRKSKKGMSRRKSRKNEYRRKERGEGGVGVSANGRLQRKEQSCSQIMLNSLFSQEVDRAYKLGTVYSLGEIEGR